jgi:hypothetical protein
MPPDEAELIEGELVDEQPVALALRPSTLFRTSDPSVALQRMAEGAKAVADVIEAQKLYARIRGKKYVLCTGWKTAGAMYGLSPYTVSTRANESGDGYVARVEIRTLDERTIACAEGECARDEDTWKDRQKHALRAMAETRATSRAFRGPLEQIFVLAGFQPTSFEEMPAEAAASEPPSSSSGPIPQQAQPTAQQAAEITDLISMLSSVDPSTDWKARCVEISGVSWKLMTGGAAAGLIDQLQKEFRKLADEDGEAA